MIRYSNSSSFISSLQPIKSGSHLKPNILAATPQNLQYFEMRVGTESLLFNKVFWVVYSLLFLLIFTHSPISSVSAFLHSQLTISLKNWFSSNNSPSSRSTHHLSITPMNSLPPLFCELFFLVVFSTFSHFPHLMESPFKNVSIVAHPWSSPSPHFLPFLATFSFLLLSKHLKKIT